MATQAKRNRRAPREYDHYIYGWRLQVGNFFAKIGEFRPVATRYVKTRESFAAVIWLVAGVIVAR